MTHVATFLAAGFFGLTWTAYPDEKLFWMYWLMSTFFIVVARTFE